MAGSPAWTPPSACRRSRGGRPWPWGRRSGRPSPPSFFAPVCLLQVVVGGNGAVGRDGAILNKDDLNEIADRQGETDLSPVNRAARDVPFPVADVVVTGIDRVSR